MKILTFDCETTGLPDYDAAVDAPRQPWLVELACELLEITPNPDESRLLDVLGEIVQLPLGVTISAEAAAIHGITNYDCAIQGLPLHIALLRWQALAMSADVIVAHNLRFDAFVLRTAYRRAKLELPAWLNERQKVCTMLAASRVMKLPFATGGGERFVSLGEAYQHFVGEPLERGHEAVADVRATRRVLVELVRRGDIVLTGRTAAPAAARSG